MKNKSVDDIQTDNNKKSKEDAIAREIMEWLVSIIVAVALVMILHNYIGQIVRVDGASMEPTLYTNERVIVGKINYNLGKTKRGDIVITHFPDDYFNYVKRVIGLPGDKLSVKDGNLYINDVLVEEPYIKEKMLMDFDEIIIPENHYFVMGDNRNNSRDSRSNSVGILPKELLGGKVILIVWPFDKIEKLEQHQYLELTST